MLGQGGKGLPLRHRRPARQAGDDDALADVGQGIFPLHCRRRTGKAGHAGDDGIGDPQSLQPVHLLPDGPVEAGVPGVEADHRLPGPVGRLHTGQDLLQGHFRAVVHPAARLTQAEKGRVHQAAGVDDHVGGLKGLCAFQRHQLRVAGARAQEGHHGIHSFTITRVK